MVTQLTKKFPIFHGTSRFITVVMLWEDIRSGKGGQKEIYVTLYVMQKSNSNELYVMHVSEISLTSKKYRIN